MHTPEVERKTMARWTAAQYLRVPARRQAANEMFDNLTKMTLAVGGKQELRKRLEAESGGPVSEPECTGQ